MREPGHRIPKRHHEKARSAVGLGAQVSIGAGKDEVERTEDHSASASPVRASRWKLVGPEEELDYLSVDDVLAIHWAVVKDFENTSDPVDPPGVRDDNLLSSAVFRPRTGFQKERKYPTVAMAGAALFHAIVHNHPFHNGNKRTALVSLVVFLDQNGYCLDADQAALYDYVLKLAAHRVVEGSGTQDSLGDSETLEVARWLRANTHRLQHHEHPLQFRELRAILTNYGCRIESPRKGYVVIKRDGHQVHIAYRGEGDEADRATIHKIRKELQLDHDHGYDSAIFYNKEARVPEFIRNYRSLLSRLAKV